MKHLAVCEVMLRLLATWVRLHSVHGGVKEDMHARGSMHKVKKHCVIVCTIDVIVWHAVVV